MRLGPVEIVWVGIKKPEWKKFAEASVNAHDDFHLKISAIKEYRARFGSGLKEAKDAVEAYMWKFQKRRA